jgi:hypothetical protein
VSPNAKIGIVVSALVVAAVVYVATRPKTNGPAPISSFKPSTGDGAAPLPTVSGGALALAAMDAGVTTMELRNWRTRIDEERCSQAAQTLNKLDGRAPTDPKAINTLSLCLQYGNVAWMACINDAKDFAGAKTCNVRFLQPPPP